MGQAEGAWARARGGESMDSSDHQFPEPALEPLDCPAQGREVPAPDVPRSWGHCSIKKQHGRQGKIPPNPQLQATVPWGKLGPVMCLQKAPFPYLGSRMVY